MPSDSPSYLAAVLRLRCPRCRKGAVFKGRLAMHERCPLCGYEFEREPGYFFGAMYFSYTLGVLLIALLSFAAYWVVPPMPLQWYAVVGWALFLPLVPAVYRYSRVLWMNFDRRMDPGS